MFVSIAEKPHLYSSVPEKRCYCPQYVNFLYLLIFWLTDQSCNVMTRNVTISVPAEQASVSHLYRCNSNSIHNTAVYVGADITFNCSFSWKCLLWYRIEILCRKICFTTFGTSASRCNDTLTVQGV